MDGHVQAHVSLLAQKHYDIQRQGRPDQQVILEKEMSGQLTTWYVRPRHDVQDQLGRGQQGDGDGSPAGLSITKPCVEEEEDFTKVSFFSSQIIATHYQASSTSRAIKQDSVTNPI